MDTASGPLETGTLLAGRYLLLEEVAAEGPAVLWRAADEVLARTVAVRVLPTPNKAAREAAAPFLEAAVLSGRVNHPGLARVYDAALEPRPGRGNDVAYLIREWVEGQPLDEHLDEVGALAGTDAADVLRQAADALSAAHAAGLLHGRVHPGNVVVTPSGRVRLTDAAVAGAVRGIPAPVDLRAGVRADTRDLAAVLYALVTARWPAPATSQPGGSLDPAPVTDGHPMTPRQLRAGVPRALDSVVRRGLMPDQAPTLAPLVTPAALADAADSSVAELRAAQAEQAAPTAPSRFRTWLPWGAAGAFLVAVAVTGWLLGLAVGDLPRRTDAVDAIVSTTDAPTPGVPAAANLDLSKVVVRDFDPEGTDGQENADKVRNAVDGFPDTTWPTSRYKSPTFGGLKDGVGLLLDLGSPRALHAVQVGFSATGAQMELRVGDTPPTDAASMRTVATARDGKQVVTLRPPAGTRARFLLVWITTLPADGDGYRVGVSELRIT